MVKTKRKAGSRRHILAASLTARVALCVVACSDDEGTAVVDRGLCEAKQATFEAFLTAHSSCVVDTDCTIIGDCCPHADFPVVRSDVSAQARQLQLGLCIGPCDGPTYAAMCRAGKCERAQNPPQQWCGAAHPRDGGAAALEK